MQTQACGKTQRHKPKHSDICEYIGIQKHASPGRKIQKHKYQNPEACKWMLGHFYSWAANMVKPHSSFSFPLILSTGPNIGQSYNLSHIHAHMCLREVIPRSSHCSCQHKFSISQPSLSQKDKTKSRVAWYVCVHVSIRTHVSLS